MKTIQISTYDIQGGAAKAAYRLHQGLRQIGQKDRMVVRHKVSTDASVLAVTTPVNVPNSFTSAELQDHYIDTHRTPLSSTIFSLSYPGYDLSALAPIQTADIINLHWVARFQSLVTLQKLFSLGKPVVWTLHDQWAFTGGCHYSAGCKGYQQNCTACPQLADELNHIPEAILMDKFDLWRDANLTIVTPSRWLADCAQESALFQGHRIEVIANSVETNVFRTYAQSRS
ncbi:MAG: glycosyltransferase [Thioploca sp.]|nr:glycosyltransferase [Thioploca sp.]